MERIRLHRVAVATAALVLLPVGASAAPNGATPALHAAASCIEASWDAAAPRPAEYSEVVQRDLPITMSDGVVLYGDLHRPDADGPYPTIVTTTAYGKNALGPESYFPERGYAQLVVDLRGTGVSGGQWDAFSEREQRDVAEVVEWAASQDWSTGDVGMYGASYLGITQLFAARQHPHGLKAIFPIVPVADAYRDTVFVGGQVNLAFIPLWMGLVTGLSATPGTTVATDPQAAATNLADHLLDVADYQVPLVTDAFSGGDVAYDGPFWRLRSPIEIADEIDVPTFLAGGLNDLFQRGEPLLYERMKDNTLTKLLIGPWGHVDGSMGSGLPADGVPTYQELATAWFDRWVREVDNGAECFPDVTQWHWISNHYESVPDWPHPDLHPATRYLGPDGTLTVEAPGEGGGDDVLPQVYGNGLCSRSTSQWLMGAADRTPCQTDNRLTELAELTYTTPPLEEETVLDGPIAAHLWVSTTAQDAVVVARLTAVSPDGASRELSTGILAATFRAVDESRSRIVDGIDLQPWHPFTRDSVEPVTAGEPMVLDVEIFPTSARIPAGWSLRLAIGTSDFPHAVSPLPQATASIPGLLTILHDADHPSSIAVPVVASSTSPDRPVPPDNGPAPAPTPDGEPGAAFVRRLPSTGGGGAGVLLALLGLVLVARRRSAA